MKFLAVLVLVGVSTFLVSGEDMTTAAPSDTSATAAPEETSTAAEPTRTTVASPKFFKGKTIPFSNGLRISGHVYYVA
ncbi:mucin-like protein 1 precursor, partial [Daubentonia madagascariensis]